MAVVSEPPRAVYAAAVEALSGRVVRALEDADDTFELAAHLDDVGDRTAGLAAVRVLGADALLPFTLGTHRPGPDDADVIAASFRAFPASQLHPDVDDGPLPVGALRDWATGQALARLGITDVPQPAHPVLPDEPPTGHLTWLQWASGLAQLSPLAAPRLDSELHARARGRQVDTARGLTRAIMRRDHLTAARLARWLAMVSSVAPAPFAVDTVLRYLELMAEDDPLTRLELVVAHRGGDQ